MNWSPQQAAALLAVKRWLDDPHSPQIFRLFGWAGTGKTTLAKEINAMVDGQALFMTFTGKAALVLQKKGCPGATTIHSAIYKPIEDQLTGEVHFKLNAYSPVGIAKLVVVDEVSMVDEALGNDLLSFGTKILVLGDPAQLPPISGEGFFTSQEPDVLLTEIHRQAAENPIIRMSMDLRDGGKLKPGTYGDSRVILRDDLDREEVPRAGQVLVGLNRSRHTWNKRIRRSRGLLGEAPVLGDRLVCLRNNSVKGLLNGGLWEPTKIGITRAGNVKMSVKSLDGLGRAEVVTPLEFFNGTENKLSWREKKDADQFTFGWALTCHKAQGSQWDDVLVFDESYYFKEAASNWIYTAITRAAERVTVVQE